MPTSQVRASDAYLAGNVEGLEEADIMSDWRVLRTYKRATFRSLC